MAKQTLDPDLIPLPSAEQTQYYRLQCLIKNTAQIPNRNGKIPAYIRIRKDIYLTDGSGKSIVSISLANLKVKQIKEEYQQKQTLAIAQRLVPQPIETTSPTLTTFYQQSFIKSPKWQKYSHRHRSEFDKTFANKVLPSIGSMPIHLIQRSHLDAFNAALKKQNLSDKTVSNIMYYIRAVFQLAYEYDILTHKPDSKMFGDLTFHSEPKPYYDHETLGYLIAAAKYLDTKHVGHNYLCQVLLGARAGLRVEEILALEWSDIHFPEGKLVISKAETLGFIKLPKNNKTRHVELDADTLVALKAHRHLASSRVLYSSLNAKRDGSWLTASGLRDRMQEIERTAITIAGKPLYSILETGKRIPLEPKGGMHILRHTYASHLIIAGVDMYQVMRLGGWSSIGVLQRYAHLSPATLKDSVQKAFGTAKTLPIAKPE